MIRRHKLQPGDYQRRNDFCQWLRARPPRFLENLIIGDEARFALNTSVNTHKVRQYAPRGQQPLDFANEHSDNRKKLTVWMGLVGNGTLTGPIFFRRNINGDQYLQMINDDVVPFIDNNIARFWRQRNGQLRYAWWAQDGTPPHRRRAVTEHLAELFGHLVISLNHAVEWPPRSPDLTPLDFFWPS